MEIKNAEITSTQITMSDHGCLTFWLEIEGYGWSVNYGGYCIGHGYLGADKFSAENGHGLEAMMHIMDVVGVDTWEKLKGQLVRVKTGDWGDSVKVIGNIMKDDWFDINAFFKEKREGERKSNGNL